MKHRTFCGATRAARAGALAFAALLVVACGAAAQTLVIAAPELPLRNLQIEVRQLQSDARDSAGLGAGGTVQLGSGGQVGINGQLQIQQRTQTRSGSTSQFALVLNGRSTRITLGASVPLRVYQSYVRNGQRVLGQGTVLIDAGTGFSATPRWDGSDMVELEIGAQQTLNTAPQGGGLNPNASITSVVAVPLGEWTTIAQSDQSASSSDRGLAAGASTASQSAVEVQVRVTVR